MTTNESGLILAPLRGVTVRCFRETFAPELAAAGFAEAITPFVTATPGFDPLSDRELKPSAVHLISPPSPFLLTTPQFIGKDPEALRVCLRRIKDAGYETADLNCGCPFPMVRNKGRGSGILKTPDILRRMLDVGWAEMGEGKFSIKARLGVKEPDELLKLMPLLNAYPLRFLTVHARTAVQMYEGSCDWDAFRRIEEVAKVPLVANGDLKVSSDLQLQLATPTLMVGRSFVRALGEGEGSRERLARYLAASEAELSGPGAVLGRMKELLSYWKDLPTWRRRWQVIKLARSVEEFRLAAGC